MLEWIENNPLLAGLILVLVLLVITMIIVFIVGKKKEAKNVMATPKQEDSTPNEKLAAEDNVEKLEVSNETSQEEVSQNEVLKDESNETPVSSSSVAAASKPTVVKKEAKPASKQPAKKAAKPAAGTAKKAAAPASKEPAKKEEKAAKYHVSQNKDDDSEYAKMWRVRKEGSQKTIKFFKTQKEAIEYAEALAQSAGSSVVIHKMDGSIRKQNYQK